MPDLSDPPSESVGLIGFGAFGQLIARHIGPYFRLSAYDPALGLEAVAARHGVRLTSLREAASCDTVVLATPVRCLAETIEAIAPHIRPGALVLDVGSVKLGPAELMTRGLPAHAEIAATHPLFGPQSARHGIEGLKIALCPIRGQRCHRLAAFLRHQLKLNVILTTPEEHDRDAATVQGLTHLIAKVLIQMEPLPREMTTKSFDLLMEAVGMVRNDAPEVFEAIERANPYAPGVRRRFFELAAALNADLVEGPSQGHLPPL